MMGRNCQKCKEPLGEYDYFFCSSCGVKLSKENIREPHAIKVRTYLMYQDEDKFSLTTLFQKIADRNFLAIAGLLLFIGVVVFGISTTGILELMTSKISRTARIPEIIIPTKQEPVLQLGTNYVSGTFDENALINLIPANVDFYVEGFDVAKFSEHMILDEDLEPLFSKSRLLLENNLVGYYFSESNNAWAYILVPTDVELVEKVLEDIEDEYWSFRIVNDLLVMASDESIFSQTERVINKIVPSLALNPEFVKKIQDLPKEGQFRVVFLNSEMEDVLKNSLGGLDQMLIGNINKLILSEFDGVVIR